MRWRVQQLETGARAYGRAGGGLEWGRAEEGTSHPGNRSCR